MKIYLAGPLFSEAERAWHRGFKKRLESEGHTVVWPGDLFSPEEDPGEDAAVKIMLADSEALLGCGAVAALLDGPQVDDGTAWEIGFAYARGIPVIGIRTDFRQCGDLGGGSIVNAMIQGSVCGMARSQDEAAAMLRDLGCSRPE